MIVEMLNQQGGVGQARLAVKLAGEWLRRGGCVTRIDADPRVSSVEGPEERARERWPALVLRGRACHPLPGKAAE